MSLPGRAWRAVTLNPAVTVAGVSVAVDLIAGPAGLTRDQAGALTVTVAATGTVIMGLAARPRHVAAIPPAITTVLVALAAFGLKLTPEQVGFAAAAASGVLGMLTHTAVVPAPAARQGVTATELMLAPNRSAIDPRS
jgi:hypothetical protein